MHYSNFEWSTFLPPALYVVDGRRMIPGDSAREGEEIIHEIEREERRVPNPPRLRASAASAAGFLLLIQSGDRPER